MKIKLDKNGKKIVITLEAFSNKDIGYRYNVKNY